jgi:molybdate transport system substrate-binding protein
LALALKDGRLKRLAIANPAHAPYGKRAEEALRHAGLWDGLSGRLVFGENVSQAAQFAVSGSAQGGIVAHSLALALQRRGQGDFALIPAAWHKPLAQRMVIMQSAPSSAQRLWDYLETPAAQAVWAAHGFVLGGGH